MLARRLSITLALAIGLVGCDEEPQEEPKLPATEEVLAQYQTLHIGQQKLTLPTVALLSSTRNTNLTLRNGTQVPIDTVLSQGLNGTQVSLIQINLNAYRELRDYSLHEQAYVPSTFCQKLLAPWEREHCRQGLYDGKHVFLTHYFSVVERDYLLSTNEQLFGISGKGPSGGESARKMLAQPDGPMLDCTPSQKPLCTAVMPIRADVIVVWPTTRETFEAESKQIDWLVEDYLSR